MNWFYQVLTMLFTYLTFGYLNGRKSEFNGVYDFYEGPYVQQMLRIQIKCNIGFVYA